VAVLHVVTGSLFLQVPLFVSRSVSGWEADCVFVVEAPLFEEVEQLAVILSSSSSAGAPSPNAVGALFAAANKAPVMSKKNTADDAPSA